MKKRLGFVSNSSSSSFIMISKEELTKEKLNKIFGLPAGHVLQNIGSEISHTLLNCASQESFEEFLDNRAYTAEEFAEELKERKGTGSGIFELALEAHEKGWYIYSGSCCDDNGDSIEAFLCNRNLDIRTEYIAIYKERGY
jgi:hypothetical protein